MTCFACDREPAQQCSRCGRPYCDEHGEELCDVCLQPSGGVPSFSLYRGSLLALLVGTALAVWLLVQPTGSEGDSGLRPIVLTPTSAAARNPAPAATQPAINVTPVPTTPGAGTPTAQPRVTGTTTPLTAGTPTTPSAAGDYTVVSGDTLSSICEKVKPAGMSVSDCVDQVVRLNNLANANDLSVGQRLRVPR